MATVDNEDDRALKAKHRALWASGDYPAVAAELIRRAAPLLGLRPEVEVASGDGVGPSAN